MAKLDMAREHGVTAAFGLLKGAVDQSYELFGLLFVANTHRWRQSDRLGPLVATWAGCGSQAQRAHTQLNRFYP